MQKKISHIVFFVILLIVSFSHYEFAKNDKRNNIDIHDDIYVNASVDYFYYLKGQELNVEVLTYHKIIGAAFYVFGKSYFVLRMTYLFFLLLFLVSLYFVVYLLFASFKLSLVAVVLHLTIPGVVSFSRICWPQLYCSFFILMCILFLFLFMEKPKYRPFYMLMFAFSAFFAVFTHYSSVIYICMFLGASVCFNRKNNWLVLARKYSYLLLPMITLVVFYFIKYADFWKNIFITRFEFFKGFSLVNFVFMVTHTDLFFFGFQFYLYLGLSFLLFFFFVLSRKNERAVYLYGFFFSYFLCLLFFLIPSSVKITFFSLTSALVILSYYFICHAPKILLKVFYLYLAVMFLLLNVFPSLVLSDYQRLYSLDKTAVISDARSRGGDELKLWAEEFADTDVSLFVLSFCNDFYPENSISYVTFLDLKMLSSAGSMNLMPDGDSIDYLIFEDVLPEAYGFFKSKEHFARYEYVRSFLKSSLNFKEIKRIKSPLKDIVIYKTLGVFTDF